MPVGSGALLATIAADGNSCCMSQCSVAASSSGAAGSVSVMLRVTLLPSRVCRCACWWCSDSSTCLCCGSRSSSPPPVMPKLDGATWPLLLSQAQLLVVVSHLL